MERKRKALADGITQVESKRVCIADTNIPPEIWSYILEYATYNNAGAKSRFRIYNTRPKYICKAWHFLYHEIMKRRIRDMRKDDLACVKGFSKAFSNNWHSFSYRRIDLSVTVKIDEKRKIRCDLATNWIESRIDITHEGFSTRFDILPGMTRTLHSAKCDGDSLFEEIFQVKALYYQITIGTQKHALVERLQKWLDLPENERTKRFSPEELKKIAISKAPENLIIWV
jgi:hypothetical protein